MNHNTWAHGFFVGLILGLFAMGMTAIVICNGVNS